MTTHSELHFVFTVTRRQWRPLGDHGPSGEIFVACSLPGNLVAGGADADTAIKSLQTLIEAAMEHAGDARSWWAAKADAMGSRDRNLFWRVVGEQMLKLESPVEGRGYRFSQVDETAGNHMQTN